MKDGLAIWLRHSSTVDSTGLSSVNGCATGILGKKSFYFCMPQFLLTTHVYLMGEVDIHIWKPVPCYRTGADSTPFTS